MTKTFTTENVEYTITICTAVAATAGDTTRQPALLVENTTDSGEKLQFVVFGYDMPETVEDFEEMSEDSCAWSADCDDLDTVEIC